jgi:hypothetical protein
MFMWKADWSAPHSSRQISPLKACIGLLLVAGGLAWCPWAQAEDVVLLSSTRLARTAEFNTLLGLYQQALTDSEGLSSRYVEVDSAACQNAFGTRAANVDDWREVKRVLARIRERTGARYVLILGGRLVIPRPAIPLAPAPGTVVAVESDGWYLDFNDDRIVDEGISIGRFADQGVAFGNEAAFPRIDSLLASLRTAIVLHLRGGVTLDNPASFMTGAYETPPFGVGPECTQTALFLELLSTADQIDIFGHGEINYFRNNDGMLILDPEHLNPQMLQQNHPMIFAWGPCNSGRLNEMCAGYPPDDPFPIGFPRDFQLAGAAAFIGRTTDAGFYHSTTNLFFEEFKAGARLGDALFTAIRESTLDAVALYGERGLIPAQHFCLYGDPTLRLTPHLPGNAHRPVFQAFAPEFPAPVIRVNGLGPGKTGQFGPFAVGSDKLIVQVRPQQVGGPAFIQTSSRGMTCKMLVSSNTAFTGKTIQISGVFKPGHYPEKDRYEFSLGPAQQASRFYFRIQAANALGSAQLPLKGSLSNDAYSLVFTGKPFPSPIGSGWFVP